MSVIGSLVGGVVGAVSSIFSKPKAASTTVSIPRQVQVRTNSAASDALLARRGSRANQRTGLGGAEAPGGTKTKLGQ